MPQTLEATLPGFPIRYGYKVVMEARDPATGNAVSGVTVSNVNIYGLDLSGNATPDLTGPFMWVPGPSTGP